MKTKTSSIFFVEGKTIKLLKGNFQARLNLQKNEDEIMFEAMT